jgi:hypothetical protein
MRELRVWLVAKLNERNDDSAKESHEGNRRYYAGMASECYEARVELDRLLSRSPAAQAKEAT